MLRPTQVTTRGSTAFRLQDFYLLWWDFPDPSTKLLYSPQTSTKVHCSPYYPAQTTVVALHLDGLGYSRFARRYLENRVFFPFLEVLRCFNSLACPPVAMYSPQNTRAFPLVGTPIRISADQRSFAATRSFSQLTTSFFGSWHLGIHRTPLFTCLTSLPRCVVFKEQLKQETSGLSKPNSARTSRPKSYTP